MSAKICLLLTVYSILLSFVLSSEIYTLEAEGLTDRNELPVLEKDVLAVYINPVGVEVKKINFKPLNAGDPLDLQVSTNYTDPYLGKGTVIWMRPGARGTYNLTLTIESNQEWNYTITVYTQNPEFYGSSLSNIGGALLYRGPYVRSGNWTISVILVAYKKASPSIFQVDLPTPVNAALLIAVTGLIAYLNVFLVCDTYFKNKKEIVSNKRWIIVAALIIVSAFVVYELYILTTF